MQKVRFISLDKTPGWVKRTRAFRSWETDGHELAFGALRSTFDFCKTKFYDADVELQPGDDVDSPRSTGRDLDDLLTRPHSERETFHYANDLLEELDPDACRDAIAILRPCLSKYGTSSGGCNLLGVAYFGAEEYETALDYFYRAVKDEPTFEAAWVNTAICLWRVDRRELAKKVFLIVMNNTLDLELRASIDEFLTTQSEAE